MSRKKFGVLAHLSVPRSGYLQLCNYFFEGTFFGNYSLSEASSIDGGVLLTQTLAAVTVGVVLFVPMR